MALTELEASPVKGATTIETKPEVGGLGEDVEESPYKEDTEEYEEVESEIGVAEEKEESPVQKFDLQGSLQEVKKPKEELLPVPVESSIEQTAEK